jgi:P-type Cu+ transporter
MKQTVHIKISGMDCSSCVMDIDGVLEDIQGVEEARTSFSNETTSIRFDPQKVAPEDFIQTLVKAGYTAQIINGKH